MAATGHKNRSIKRLHLDLRNPRLGRPSVDTEAEAMARLLKEFGTKIIGLARSIAEHGLNPTESWAIVHEDNKYVVLEGNRRLVACRLLDNPRKAPDPETAATFERIKRGVRTTGSYLNPSCVEFEHRADARYWIHLKHHGAGSGEGTAAWGPEMVYLDQVNSGSSPVEWNEFWYWLEETYEHDRPLVDLIDQARHDQYTLMERVYTWKVKELLGASFTQPGQISVDVDTEKIKPFIHELITGMLTPQPKDPKAPGAADVLVISSRTLNSRDPARKLLGGVWRDTVGDADVTPATTLSADTDASSPAQGTEKRNLSQIPSTRPPPPLALGPQAAPHRNPPPKGGTRARPVPEYASQGRSRARPISTTACSALTCPNGSGGCSRSAAAWRSARTRRRHQSWRASPSSSPPTPSSTTRASNRKANTSSTSSPPSCAISIPAWTPRTPPALNSQEHGRPYAPTLLTGTSYATSTTACTPTSSPLHPRSPNEQTSCSRPCSTPSTLSSATHPPGWWPRTTKTGRLDP